MRTRGRPHEAVSVEDLRAWLELEADTILGRLERVPNEERRRWMRRQFRVSADRYAERRDRWRRAVEAADVVDEIVEILRRVEAGEEPYDWQRARIERAFISRGFATPRAGFIAVTAEQVHAAGGRIRWAIALVSEVTGVSGYALREHRQHRARVESEVVDTLRTHVEREEIDEPAIEAEIIEDDFKFGDDVVWCHVQWKEGADAAVDER